MVTLLSFHKSILEKIHDPSTSELLVLARGLGLRRIVCKLLQIYDSPQNLVILVNASQDEASGIGEELGVMGCREPGLRIVGFETGRKDRQDLYKRGGLISITSQILTVDMLTSDIPTHLITGLVMLHGERVTPSSSEAFIIRLFRENNKTGFLKAFSDQPEHITSGLSPLRTIMKELQLRTVHIYPRFHQEISDCLERDRSVLQLTIDMTPYMSDIHGAIVQCMNSTLAELKRSNTSLDLDDLTVENAYFKSFDYVVRRQLDPIWHKVGPKTKQLVNDLSTLRRILGFLLNDDAFSFQQYLEGLIEANTHTNAGNARQNQSPWMLTNEANTIFQYAKRRCFTVSDHADRTLRKSDMVFDVDEDEWAAMDEAEGNVLVNTDGKKEAKNPKWLPKGMEPVLEEQPKWSLVAAALQEIEEEMIRRESKLSSNDPGSNTVLIMTSSLRTSELLSNFLSKIDNDAPPGSQGRKMMEDRLRWYLWRWRRRQIERKLEKKQPQFPTVVGPAAMTEANKNPSKQDQERQARNANRRRTRGGAAVSGTRPVKVEEESNSSITNVDPDAKRFADFFTEQEASGLMDDLLSGAILPLGEEFDANYGLVAPEQTVIIHTYSDDSDDRMLSEIQPRYIIMVEPNLDFVRRVEVYKRSNPGLGVRVYLLIYNLSFEEAKYLGGVRREKVAFERLIKERGSMLMPILEVRETGKNDSMLKTISSRIAGGRKDAAEPPRIIVDIREFRSSLPSLLHATGDLVIPATLTVGDYILTPEMCVERKSVPDLISSFNSGRLYTQCELMSAHYKQPILLIEWEENKSFSFEAVGDAKQYAKTSDKYPSKKKPQGSSSSSAPSPQNLLQSKLVLLTLSFPRLRIIWSSSPYISADIFNDLKTNNPEPDPVKAIAIGAEEHLEAGGVNVVAEELLRSIPGITAKNVKHVMNKVDSVRELCDLSLAQVQEILGVDPGKACWEFIHQGERKLT